MKKIISLFLVAIITTALVVEKGFAEDFTIHSGVIFGDTKEEVKAKETLDSGESGLINSGDCLIYNGKVAGYDDTNVFYQFDETSGKLFNALYYFRGLGDQGNNQYKKFKEQLEKKYGEPLNKKDEIYYEIWGNKDLSFYINGVYYLSRQRLYDHNVWVVPYNGYKVVISLVQQYPPLINYIDYRFYTDEEVSLLEAAYNDDNQQLNEDL